MLKMPLMTTRDWVSEIAVAFLIGGVVAILDSSWTRGVWLGALFLLVLLLRRTVSDAVQRRRRAAEPE